ncbi:MAG: DNA-binding protein [bacterium]|nr:DNA-binding protein [bacterium]
MDKPEIFEACERIAEEGGKLTVRSLRDELGRGSFSELGPALREWKRSRAEQPPGGTPTPDAVSERGRELALQLWTLALGQSEERLEAERRALQEARSELEAERAEAERFADEMEAQMRQHEAKAATVERKAAETAQEAAKREGWLKERLDRAQEEAREARSREAAAREEAARTEGQAEALRAQIAGLTERLGIPASAGSSPKVE